MKIVYLSKTDTGGPGSRYRIYQFKRFFEESGVDIEIIPAFSNAYLSAEELQGVRRALRRGVEGARAFARRILSLRKIFSADLVAIEREFFPRFPPIFELMLKTMGKGYVLEFDDAVFHSPGRRWKYPSTVSMARKVITGNKYLMEYAARYNDEVFIVPTCVDPESYNPREEYGMGEFPKIGWVGLPYNFPHLKSVEAPLLEVLEESGGELVVLSGRDPEMALPCSFVKWSLEEEAEIIKTFDVGIMPLLDTPYSRGKCGLKILQYMAAGVPVIASPVGVNTDIIHDGVNGFLAQNITDWMEKLKALLIDGDLRENLGREGRKTVEEHFSLQAWAKRLLSIYGAEEVK